MIDMERLGAALDATPKSGGGLMAHCPAHEDRNKSLSIDSANDGKILLRCFAGCSQESVINELRARGLWNADTQAYQPSFQKSAAPRKSKYIDWTTCPATSEPKDIRHARLGTPSAIWAYRDIDGHILGYACRFDQSDGGKVVLPFTYGRDAAGRESWQWKAFSEPRPLYGAERLVMLPHNAPVLIVEGEKTAEAARKLFPDSLILTWPGGCKAVSKAGWSILKGKNVVLWPDNDLPGSAAMTEIIDSLLPIASQVRYVTPPPDTKKGWDLADALIEGWTSEFAQQWIADHSQTYHLQAQQPDKSEGAPKVVMPTVVPLKIKRCIQEDPPLRKFYAKYYLPAGTVGIVNGTGATGKSYLLLLKCVALSLGRSIPPFDISEPVKVMILNVEDSDQDLWFRLHHIAQEYKITQR